MNKLSWGREGSSNENMRQPQGMEHEVQNGMKKVGGRRAWPRDSASDNNDAH